jgi:hypothetical protein
MKTQAQKPADADKKDETVLYYLASARGSLHMVEHILQEHGAWDDIIGQAFKLTFDVMESLEAQLYSDELRLKRKESGNANRGQ